jgi:hypothetical protein
MNGRSTGQRVPIFYDLNLGSIVHMPGDLAEIARLEPLTAARGIGSPGIGSPGIA